MVIRSMVVLVAAAGAVQSRQLPGFDLPDQFGRRHPRAELLGGVGLVIVGDRACAGSIGRWIRAIREALPDPEQFSRVRRLPVVDLREVPLLLRGIAMSRFPKDTAQWVALDWDGALAQAFTMKPGHCLVLVTDAAGRVLERGGGAELDELEARRLAAVVRRALASDP